jgi:DNA polymerase-3 subunit chi
MPDVHFYFGASQRFFYGCRWVRKALSEGVEVAICAASNDLSVIDQLLWTFDPLAFVPHVWVKDRSPKALPQRMASTPIKLFESPTASDLSGKFLLNLDIQIPENASFCDRVIEIVSLDLKERAQARQRWRGYEKLGFSITQHKVSISS